MKESIGDIIKETQEVYNVIQEIHKRINILADAVHQQRDVGIVPRIAKGLSRLVQIGLNILFGPVVGYLE